MSGYIGVPQYREDHTAHEAQASDDSEGPAHTCLVYGLAVEDLCIEAAHLLARSSILEPEANDGVEVGDLVGDSFRLVRSATIGSWIVLGLLKTNQVSSKVHFVGHHSTAR